MAFAVISPSLLTVAIFVLLDCQVTVLLLALLGVTVAVSCRVLSTTTLAVVLFSVIPVASWLTVISHEAFRFDPSAVVTVMVTVPRPFAVTRPLLFTVATLVSLEVQVTALLEVLLGVTVTVNCKVSPLLRVAEVLFSEMPVASCGVTVT